MNNDPIYPLEHAACQRIQDHIEAKEMLRREYERIQHPSLFKLKALVQRLRDLSRDEREADKIFKQIEELIG